MSESVKRSSSSRAHHRTRGLHCRLLLFSKRRSSIHFFPLYFTFSLFWLLFIFPLEKKKGKERGGIGVPIFTCPGCVLLLFLYRSVYLNGHMDRHTSKHTRMQHCIEPTQQQLDPRNSPPKRFFLRLGNSENGLLFYTTRVWTTEHAGLS